MSWSISGVTIPKGARLDQAGTILAGANPCGNADLPEERWKAVAAARAVALEIIGGGSLGPADAGYSVSLAGHCNPSNVKPEGWCPDCISVQVGRLD